MTLKDWSALSGILPTTPTTERGAVSVVSDPSHSPHHKALWHLLDFKVSSVSGVVVWLVPVYGKEGV